jgi:hypothetical protein
MSPRRQVGRLPIRRAVFSLRAKASLGPLREAGLDGRVYIGRGFRPLVWETQGDRAWLACLPGD